VSAKAGGGAGKQEVLWALGTVEMLDVSMFLLS
jgi:hypothetical protein